MSADNSLNTSSSTINTSSSTLGERHVSFGAAPEIFEVPRLDLSFYHAEDYARFRQHRDVQRECDAEDAFKASPQQLALVEKRQRGYQLLAARRTQRRQGND